MAWKNGLHVANKIPGSLAVDDPKNPLSHFKTNRNISNYNKNNNVDT